MLTLEQFYDRALGIGASDIPVLLGISPYAISVHDVYMAKVCPEACFQKQKTTLAMEIGSTLEPLGVRELGRELGIETIRNSQVMVHPQIDWARATPDGFAGDCPIEVKVPGYWVLSGWGEDGEQVPDFVYAQVQWQLFVSVATKAYVCAIFGTEFRYYVIERSDEVIKALYTRAAQFWNDHVVARVPPPVDGSEGATRMVDMMFPKAKEGTVLALQEGDGFLELAREALHKREERDEADQAYEKVRQELKLRLEETESAQARGALVGPDVKVTWSNTKTGRRLDIREVKAKKKPARAEAAE